MQHKRFAIQKLMVGDREVSVRYCDLLIATSEGRTDPDWECLAASNDEVQLVQMPHVLTLRSGGRTFEGDAVLVRSDGLAHVFRGTGPLVGIAATDLPG